MIETIKPYRSVLYMPGANTRALDKARSLKADAIIFDLEDAVAVSEKISARENVAQALKEAGYGKRSLIVRINGCLLYTSPSPRDGLLSRMPSSA